jgi:hypothetical protein
LGHYRTLQKQNRQTKRKTKPKTPTENGKKRFTSSENVRRIYSHIPTKRKTPTTAQKPPQAKRKAAHDPQTVNGIF